MKISKERYERKYLINNLLSHRKIELLIKMHPAIFSEIYYERYINNIYFDTHNLQNFYDNVDGATNRIKVRIRWYNSNLYKIDSPTLEIKIKNGLLGKKISLPITENISLNNLSDIKEIFSKIDHSELKFPFPLAPLKPVLINRYSRKYFQTFDKKFRITIDRELTFYPIFKSTTNLLETYKIGSFNILELKYDKQFYQEASDISSLFPFRLSKSSKYVMGLERALNRLF